MCNDVIKMYTRWNNFVLDLILHYNTVQSGYFEKLIKLFCIQQLISFKKFATESFWEGFKTIIFLDGLV
jgi:hypothetical protein